MKLNEEKILKKFEKYKGYSAVLFDNEEWRESDAYEQGYNQALKDSKAPEMLEMLKECYKYLPYEGCYEKKVDNLIKQATEL